MVLSDEERSVLTGWVRCRYLAPPEGALVLDNYATHKTEAVKRWLIRHPRFHPHFTSTSSSWLNLVERWFAELTTASCAARPTAA